MISTERVGLFHVPIIVGKADLPHSEIEAYVREMMDSHNAYTSYYDNEYNQKIAKDLPHKQAMEAEMTQLCVEYLKMRNAPSRIWEDVKPFYWFSIYQEGDSHCLHNHPGAAVAGTYYPYADEESVPIRYRHPAGNLVEMSEPKFTHETWHFHRPTTGEMNVWPPWLEHQVGTQSAVDPSKARIAISFNFGRP